MKAHSSRIPTLVALFLAAPPALADTIHRVDGTTIADVTIVEETLATVTYKDGRKDETVPSDQVLKVEFSSMPEAVDSAMASLSEGDARTALTYLEDYLLEQESRAERRFKWAPAFASWKAVQVYNELGDLKGVRRAAATLVRTHADSRYAPKAYLLKAAAERQLGQPEDARATLEALGRVIAEAGLSKRWELEKRLADAQVSQATGGGATVREALSSIQREAGSTYPGVRGRARVAEGEALLAQAEGTTSTSEADALRKEARAIFEGILADGQGDEETLAGAHTGLGDCLFYIGAGSGERETLQEALMNYLRVITLYSQHSRYVAKSLYYALRCFELQGERARARDMRRELLKLYPDSSWAQKKEVTR